MRNSALSPPVEWWRTHDREIRNAEDKIMRCEAILSAAVRNLTLTEGDELRWVIDQLVIAKRHLVDAQKPWA